MLTRNQAAVAVVFAMSVAAAAGAAGLMRQLPYAAAPDEAIFVRAAARMAATGNLDPGWFGHPGSTTIYPLALVITLARGVGVSPVSLDESAVVDARRDWRLYVLGRAVSLGYFVGSLPLVYLIGRTLFDRRTGVLAAWLTAVSPLALAHAQFVRTDSAATFFGLVALLWITRWRGLDAAGRHAAIGAAIGLAIASRYFMALLIPAWILASAGTFRGPDGWHRARRCVGAGLAAIVVAFLAVTPFLLIHPGAVYANLALELEPVHLGADGLSWAGNLWWYLSRALPANLTVLVAGAALLGTVEAVRGRVRGAAAIGLFSAAFLIAISASDLHWHRWVIPLLPLANIVAAYGVTAIAQRARSGPWGTATYFALSALLLAQPTLQVVWHDWQQWRGSTRLQARSWAADHLPAGSRYVTERYSAVLADLPLRGDVVQSLAAAGHPEALRRAGAEYLISSSEISDRYRAEPNRYPAEMAFYRELEATSTLVAEVAPPLPPAAIRWLRVDCYCSLPTSPGEPTIRFYRLR